MANDSREASSLENKPQVLSYEPSAAARKGPPPHGLPSLLGVAGGGLLAVGTFLPILTDLPAGGILTFHETSRFWVLMAAAAAGVLLVIYRLPFAAAVVGFVTLVYLLPIFFSG